MILLTGTGGNVGGRVAKLLPEARHLRTAELDDAPRAMEGVDAVLLVSTGPDILRRDTLLAKAARDARVKRIVKLSSMDAARADANSLAAWHAAAEDAIRATGVAWTFVRPGGFMSNALSWVDSLKADGTVRASTGSGRIAMVHPDDIAEVIAKALTTSGPELERKILELTGPEALDYATMVKTIDRDALFIPISDEEAKKRLLQRGLPPPVAEALVGLWRAVREGQVARVTDTVERVLGKPPRRFAQWALENKCAFR